MVITCARVCTQRARTWAARQSRRHAESKKRGQWAATDRPPSNPPACVTLGSYTRPAQRSAARDTSPARATVAPCHSFALSGSPFLQAPANLLPAVAAVVQRHQPGAPLSAAALRVAHGSQAHWPGGAPARPASASQLSTAPAPHPQSRARAARSVCHCVDALGTDASSKRARHSFPPCFALWLQGAVSRPECAPVAGPPESGGHKRGGHHALGPAWVGAAGPAPKAARTDADSGEAATLSNGRDTGDTSAPGDGAFSRAECLRGGGRAGGLPSCACEGVCAGTDAQTRRRRLSPVCAHLSSQVPLVLQPRRLRVAPRLPRQLGPSRSPSMRLRRPACSPPLHALRPSPRAPSRPAGRSSRRRGTPGRPTQLLRPQQQQCRRRRRWRRLRGIPQMVCPATAVPSVATWLLAAPSA